MNNSKKRKYFIGVIVLIGLVSSVYILYGRGLAAPSQEQFIDDKNAQAAIEFLSKRWNVPKEDLYVMSSYSEHKKRFEVEIVDSVLFRSGLIAIPSEGTSKLNWPYEQAIANEGDIFLVYEYVPSKGRETRIARCFYSTPWPFDDDKSRYPVIRWSNVTSLRSGTITTAHYYKVPVLLGFPIKHAAYILN